MTFKCLPTFYVKGVICRKKKNIHIYFDKNDCEFLQKPLGVTPFCMKAS